MPAQISHWLFYKELECSFYKETGVSRKDRFSSITFLGAQGGDIFYHNQRTKPSGISFGSMLHRKDAGTFLIEFIKYANEMGLPLREDSYLFWFLLAFASHGILDRETHPYIVYFSTPTPLDGYSRLRWLRMHPFLERILDRIMFEKHFCQPLDQWSVTSLIDPGELQPPFLECMARTFRKVYPSARKINDPELRIRNAFWDTIGFLHYSDSASFDNAHWAARRDREEETPGLRRLALFHPRGILNKEDFDNRNHREWRHPITGIPSTNSWDDLWVSALEKSRKASFLLWKYIQTGEGEEDLRQALGDSTWNVGNEKGRMEGPKFSDPMPLLDLFFKQYEILLRKK